MTDHPGDLTAVALLHAYATRSLSPVEAVEACLERISILEPRLNATVTVCADSALEAAREAEARWQAGTARALEGVPFGLKDLIATAGVRTTGGSHLYADWLPELNATVAERLSDAGGILLAKLQTSEFAAGGSVFGPIANPWDTERLTAGSSSGSAAAVAAAELPLTLGTDTGGSIRIPAAFCGISGLKATYGRISRFGVFPISWSLDHIGPMARSVEDIALALSILAGYDERDPTSGRQPVPDYQHALSADLDGVRVGVPRDWFFTICDPEIAQAAHSAADVMSALGAEVRSVSLPLLNELDTVRLGRDIIDAESASLHEENLERRDEYSQEFRSHLLNGHFISAPDYLRALRLRQIVQKAFSEVFRNVDVLLTPGAVGVAPLRRDPVLTIGGIRYPWMDVIMRTSTPFNVTGLPALVTPSGINRKGLPMSIQIIGQPYDETSCLRAAHAYQTATRHQELRPTLDDSPSVDAGSMR